MSEEKSRYSFPMYYFLLYKSRTQRKNGMQLYGRVALALPN